MHRVHSFGYIPEKIYKTFKIFTIKTLSHIHQAGEPLPCPIAGVLFIHGSAGNVSKLYHTRMMNPANNRKRRICAQTGTAKRLHDFDDDFVLLCCCVRVCSAVSDLLLVVVVVELARLCLVKRRVVTVGVVGVLGVVCVVTVDFCCLSRLLYGEKLRIKSKSIARVVTKLVGTGRARPALTKTDQH